MTLVDSARALLGFQARQVPALPSVERPEDMIERVVRTELIRANGAGDPGLVAADYGTSTPAGSAIDWQYMPPVVASDANVLAGGRLSRDFPWTIAEGMRLIVPPQDYNQQWLMLNLDDPLVRAMPADRLMRILAECSPEVSRGIWDFLRLCNPGKTITAVYPGSIETDAKGRRSGRPYPKAQTALTGFNAQLDARPNSSLNTIISKLFFNAYLRGAMFGELILDLDARRPLDIAVPDAATARFMRYVDPVYGDTWVLGQWQMASWIPLIRPTIKYLPIDPAPGIPYGRSPAAPAIFASLFLLGLLHDVRRVVANQGYPRLDISVDLEKLRQSMPAQITADPQKWLIWTQNTVNTVKRAFWGLKPDQAFVHSHVVSLNRPVGTLGAENMGFIPAMIEALERMLARALKTMPLLLGNEGGGGGEANSNRQWEIEVAGVRSVQDLGQTMMEAFYSVALEAEGIAADVIVEFQEVRDAAAFRQAQTRTVENNNAAFEYDRGWIDQTEAAMKTVGHKPDQPEPRETPVLEQPNPLSPDQAEVAGEQPVPEKPRPQAGAPDNKDTADSKDTGVNKAVSVTIDGLAGHRGAVTTLHRNGVKTSL